MKKKYGIVLVVACLALSLSAFINKPQPVSSVDAFSISLNVKDIVASKAFYEKLGFTQVEGSGSITQKWMLMENGAAKVGLFQGMFPQNVITLNPSDARNIHKKIMTHGLKTTYSSGLDKTEGPASFTLSDPDGNTILVDQH